MNKLLIYILVAFIGTTGTWIANRFQLKQAVKPYKRHVERLQTDSTLKLKKIAVLTENLTLKSNSDSLKSEFISQMQGTMQQLKRENTSIILHARALEAWKLDAQDGIITDTVTYKVNIFGKRKKVK